MLNDYIKILIATILVIPLLSGCWDSQEIEQRANVLAIGIDEADEKEKNKEEAIAHLGSKFPNPKEGIIKLTAQVAVPGRIPLGPEQTKSSGSSVLVVKVIGHTFEDAMLNLQQEIADELFLGHLRIIVLNEKVAKEGTLRFNDFLRRNPEIRRTASLVVSKEPASTYMKLSPELERVPSLYLADMVDNLSALGRFPPSFIGLFWTVQSSKGQDPYLPYLAIKGKENIQLNGLAYFKGDKMAGKTTPLEIGIYMAILGIGRGGYAAFVNVPDTDEMVIVRAINRKTKINVSLKDGKPHVVIKVRYESEIDEKQGPKIMLTNSRIIKKIETETSKGVDQSIRKLIAKTQKSESDVFGFGEHFRAKLPNYWNNKVKTKDRWEEVYKNLTYDVQVSTHIHRVGMKAK
ncbi:Ger(x)C family spore germination protein [Neobacillus sp. SAB-20_R2A]|uniref:Ger(x)C family spore germination protein n=1 Tax=Neobacillus sp. SAB-20_R2A TaxID=3120519 RepID=UPI003C6E72B5